MSYPKLRIDAQADIIGLLLSSVQVRVDSLPLQATDSSGKTEFTLMQGMHSITVADVGGRPFSHFWDHDCDDSGGYLDTNRPYSFIMLNKDRDITALYKTFTQITDFTYGSSIIKGKLLDENNNPLRQQNYMHSTCTPSSTYDTVAIDRNIELQYYDGAWHGINAASKFYDDFNDGNYNGWVVSRGTWGVIGGELMVSGSGDDERIQSSWSQWNSNDFMTANVKLSSGSDVWIRLFDSTNNYYVQTSDGYNHLYLYVNGALVSSAALTGINVNNWNEWRVEQSSSVLRVYINGQKWLEYNGVPVINNGRIELRGHYSQILFDDVNVDGIAYRKDGSWSYNWNRVTGSDKIRAVYNPSNWYYYGTNAEISIL
jgi:hypothetical protein